MSDEHESSPESGFSDDERTIAVSPDAAQAIDLEEGPEVAYLTVIAGARVGEMVKLSPGDLTVGRGFEVDFRINDAGASKKHVCFTMRDDGVVQAIDLDSRNGTRLNGEPIDSAALSDGDKIHVGSTTIFRFSHTDSIEENFQQQMYDAALRDPLTGLFNRRRLSEQLEMEYSYAVRNDLPLSLVMIDVDNFKHVNDVHGHPVGDTVLHAVGQRLACAVRREDFAARYGGEEFAILCRETNVGLAKAVAERIRGMFECAAVAPRIPGLRITVSAGVAGTPDPAIGSTADLIDAADGALYAAKANGRNRVCAAHEVSRR